MKPPVALVVSPTTASLAVRPVTLSGATEPPLVESTGSHPTTALTRASRRAARTLILPPSEWPASPIFCASIASAVFASAQSTTFGTSAAIRSWSIPNPLSAYVVRITTNPHDARCSA